ncbi:phage head closure protein [Thalassospira sp. MCCC 1A01428]|uniref:phage head closure protein n=1 Tax=Thalassospira sp. MCCC 1A01428 TaxID=1470575 RepID=UPI000A2483FE|nr:phage head closure protein [Thalassospira sp. MCCC 1A01428]OSQ31340.1 hypothetical protein THS27_26390 [Thalassospira sp. MCCC 1A01428]
MGLQPGDLNESIVFQAVSTVPDAIGGQVQSWATVGAPSWARITPLSARDQVVAMQTGNSTQYRADLYQRRDITADMRILRNDGTVLEITGVLIERNTAFMAVLCKVQAR